MTCLEHQLQAADRTSLFVREFPAVPSAETNRSHSHQRTLLVVHGAAEHGGRYLQFAEMAAQAGWRVIVPDHRGHGLSGGVHVHVDRFSRYLDDLDLIYQTFGCHPSRTACVGHSLGGLIVARYVETKPQRVAAAVLLSPLFAVAIRIPRITWLAGRILALLLPQTRFSSRINPKDLTHDPNVLEKRQHDLLMRRGVTAGWFVQVQYALQDAFRDAPDLRVPLLIFHAGLDRIADPLATQRWAEAAGSPDKKLRIFPEHLHELLNEPDAPETAEIVLEWLNERIPAG